MDFPVGGTYSSDSPHVLRRQIAEARSAGINGFLTSWKSTPDLNRRLDMLVRMAHAQKFDVGVVYEALDFDRNPLPISTVRRDIGTLVNRWGNSLRSSYFGEPIIIWTGTNLYSRSDIASVRSLIGSRALLLAASKQVSDYEKIADLVDGEAYYWSSANPNSTLTQTKLKQFGAAVHRRHQVWLAPAAAGFDGRSLGHTRIIPRQGGRTLVKNLNEAYAAAPDAVGVISWNEWSENTYIEPGRRYGSQELDALRSYIAALRGRPVQSAQSPRPHSSGSWSGLRGVAALAIVTLLGTVLLTWRVARRKPPQPGGTTVLAP
jgi:Glycosyl hydrolase family 71